MARRAKLASRCLRVTLAVVVALAAGAVATVPHAAADVLWNGDLETGDLSQWSFKFLEKQLRVVSSPAREGKFALELRAVNTGDRVEVQNGKASTAVGTDRYYAWSVMAPKPLGPNDHQTGYFESKNTYNQIMAFVIKGSDVSLDTRLPSSQRRWTGRGKFTAGVWHDFVFHVKWSRDAAVGLVELWFDGEKVLEPVRVPTLWDANDAFFQIGFLSGQAGEVLYLDEAREATSLQDVLRVPAPPPPPDAGAAMGGAGGVSASGGRGGVGGNIAGAGGGGAMAAPAAGGTSGTAGASGSRDDGDDDEAGAGGAAPDDAPSSGTAKGRLGCTWAAGGVDAKAAAWPFAVLLAVYRKRRKRAARS